MMLLVKLAMLHARRLTKSDGYVPHCFKDLGHVNVIKLNTVMKQFKATVKVSGLVMSTIVFAENSMLAFKLVQYLYGAHNVVSPPIQIGR